MKTATNASEYVWGDNMTSSLRKQLETEIVENTQADPGVTSRESSEVQDMSNGELFLLWLRS